MGFRRILFIVLAVALLLMGSGCKKKKPAVPSPQEQAPTIVPPPLPPPIPAETTATVPNLPPPVPPVAAKAKPKHKKATATKTPPKAPETTKPRTVIEDGGAKADTDQLAARLPHDETVQQRQSTLDLQQVAESNLRNLTRPLSSGEQAMVQQIRSFLQQSRAAEADGDTERAYNLAMKARLLSDALVNR